MFKLRPTASCVGAVRVWPKTLSMAPYAAAAATKHLCLNLAYDLTLLAMAGVVVLSYAPLTAIQAASAGATMLPCAGEPLVKPLNRQTLQVTYRGSADAVAPLRAGTANPAALARCGF
jgi:hypothetical protein